MSLFTKPAVVGGITATRPMRRVLLVLLTDASNITGLTIAETAGVGVVLVYRCLDRLEDAKWAVDELADGPYPRRRVYRLTPAGWTQAHDLLGLVRSEARRG